MKCATLPPDSDKVGKAGTTALRTIALAGNPNAGKTTVFNALTGMRQKVGNYPGVTVEKKEGLCKLLNKQEVTILDIPGTYSLSPKSPDEEIARDVLLGLSPGIALPDAVVVVVDSSNLERNLYLATQILELGFPTIIALNMGDVAKAAGKRVDAVQLSKELGTPIVEMIALRGKGLPELREMLQTVGDAPTPPELKLVSPLKEAHAELTEKLTTVGAGNEHAAQGIALRLLCSNLRDSQIQYRFGDVILDAYKNLREELPLAKAGAAEAGARYVMLGEIVRRATHTDDKVLSHSFSDKADAILTHKVWGMLCFALITLFVFQAIFSWANVPMDLIQDAIAAFGGFVQTHMADGPLRDLLVNGIIAGVGAVVVFVPQIMILFFFIGILEDSGYMARAAFIMDRLMAKVGLHGRAFIPLMSSFACAIPGIMATRTIASRRDRMTTILIAPLMACSARIPVYTLMIATFIPAAKIAGILSLRAAVMFSLYTLGVLVAMAAAFVFRRTIFKGSQPVLMLELPPYKIPSWRNVFITMWDRASQFLTRAGTVILAISIILWAMLSYPKANPAQVAMISHSSPVTQTAPLTEEQQNEIVGLQVQNSIAGRVGHSVEPFIKPLGFNWKIGIGLIGAMAAREVFVSTIGTVYSVGAADEVSTPLRDALKNDTWPDGRPVWTTLVAVSLLVYFVIAMQCVSTLAIVRRETNSWKWPIFMQVYMTTLAWILSFIIFQGGRFLGFG
ncbi:MAG: ferrous iron transport protein B [Abditibacteriaceae bacterium]